jgi:hypothetical protein
MSMGELVGTWPVSLNARLHVYEDGFTVTRRLGRDSSHEYRDVSEIVVTLGLRVRHEAEEGSVITQATWTVRLSAGTPLVLKLAAPPVRTLAGDFFRYGIRDDLPEPFAGTLVTHIERRVAQAQLPGALATVRAGGSVACGAITVTPEGLTHAEAGALPWAEVVELYVLNHYDRRPPKAHGGLVTFVVRDAAGQVSRVHLPSDRVVNLGTLQLLCAELGLPRDPA